MRVRSSRNNGILTWSLLVTVVFLSLISCYDELAEAEYPLPETIQLTHNGEFELKFRGKITLDTSEVDELGFVWKAIGDDLPSPSCPKVLCVDCGCYDTIVIPKDRLVSQIAGYSWTFEDSIACFGNSKTYRVAAWIRVRGQEVVSTKLELKPQSFNIENDKVKADNVDSVTSSAEVNADISVIGGLSKYPPIVEYGCIYRYATDINEKKPKKLTFSERDGIVAMTDTLDDKARSIKFDFLFDDVYDAVDGGRRIWISTYMIGSVLHENGCNCCPNGLELRDTTISDPDGARAR